MNAKKLIAVSGLTLVVLALVGTSLFGFTAKPAFSEESAPAGSNSWSQLSIPALNNGNKVYAVRRSGALLLIGTQSQGMFLSTNQGGSWQAIAQYNTAYVRDLWINNSTILATTFGSGLLRSTDSGASWGSVGGIGTNFFYSLASSGSLLFVGTADNGVWRSVDNGVSWQPTGTIDSPGAVALAAVSSGVVYAGTVNNGLYKTDNSGVSWQQIGFASKTVRAIAIDPDNPLVIWASVLGEGVYRSDNGGTNWAALNNGLNSATVLSLLAFFSNGPTQVLAGTAGNGIFRWSGNAWQQDGLADKEVYALSSWDKTVYAGTNDKVWEYTFAPTPTPTPTSTATITPTPTATPTPGLRFLALRNDPFTEIGAGEEITYTISYRNGSVALSGFKISNVIPDDVRLVAGSISNGGTATGNGPGASVQWTLGGLRADITGTVSYRVKQPSQELIAVTRITNNGATAEWSVNGVVGQIHSNTVVNPSQRLYLPLLLFH